MNILLINGSRKNGNTHQLATAVIQAIQGLDPSEVRTVHLADLKMGFCGSCHACFSQSEAVCKDREAVMPLLDSILKADLLIVCSPVYVMQISALVKNWIDHFAFMVHRPRLFDKRALIVTTTAGAGTKQVVRYLRSVLPMWGINSVYSLSETLFSEKLSFSESLNRRIESVSRQIVSDHQKGVHRPPSYYHLSMHTAFRVMNHLYPDTHYERIYWKQNNLLQPHYPGPSRLSPLQRVYVGLLFVLMRSALSKKTMKSSEHSKH